MSHYKREYHLMEWLRSTGRREYLCSDNLLLLRNAFTQYSEVLDETLLTSLPLDYVVSKIYCHFRLRFPPPVNYSDETMFYYETIWRLVSAKLNWPMIQSSLPLSLDRNQQAPDELRHRDAPIAQYSPPFASH